MPSPHHPVIPGLWGFVLGLQPLTNQTLVQYTTRWLSTGGEKKNSRFLSPQALLSPYKNCTTLLVADGDKMDCPLRQI